MFTISALLAFILGGVIFYTVGYFTDMKKGMIAKAESEFRTHVVNSAGAVIWESCESTIGGGWVTRKNTRPLNADPNTPEGKVFYEYCYFPITGQWLLMTRWDVHH